MSRCEIYNSSWSNNNNSNEGNTDRTSEIDTHIPHTPRGQLSTLHSAQLSSAQFPRRAWEFAAFLMSFIRQAQSQKTHA